MGGIPATHARAGRQYRTHVECGNQSQPGWRSTCRLSSTPGNTAGTSPDLALTAEDVWLAHAQVDILCSAPLREPLVQYADALNAVARHEDRYPDWWSHVIPYKSAFIDAVRAELKWPDPPARRNGSPN